MKRALLLAALLTAAPRARALESAQFLAVPVGARGLGMGGAYTALADDAHSIDWNPAGLASAPREASFDDAELPGGDRLNYLAYSRPAPSGAFGAAVTYLSRPSIESRDAAGRPAGSFTAADFAGALAYARRAGAADLGVSVKFVQSHIGSAQATTAALDAGARRAFDAGPGRVVLGAALRNAGPGLNYASETDDLPLRLAGGAAFVFAGGHALAIEATNSPRGAGTEFGLGGEYQAVKGVFLRGGWSTQSTPGGSGFDAASGLTLGAGIRLNAWSLDYAVVPSGELGSAHRFTVTARW
jgi:hypothetical protein